jgi:hypothetical protein
MRAESKWKGLTQTMSIKSRKLQAADCRQAKVPVDVEAGSTTYSGRLEELSTANLIRPDLKSAEVAPARRAALMDFTFVTFVRFVV